VPDKLRSPAVCACRVSHATVSRTFYPKYAPNSKGGVMKKLTKARLKRELSILKQDIKDLRQAEKIWEGLLASWPDTTDYIYVDEEGAVEETTGALH